MCKGKSIFINLGMLLLFGAALLGGAEASAASEGPPYFDVRDPLFESLLTNKPGVTEALYWAGNCDDELGRLRARFRGVAKKFGYRFVYEEQLQEAVRHHLIPMGHTTPEWERNGLRGCRWVIGDPGEAFVPSVKGAPMVFGTQAWLLDPRWQGEYLRRAVERTQQDKVWGLFAGDEVWESFAIRVVPKDKRYDVVLAADAEIREKYGSGKYGMPESDEDPNPFTRIAYRRWVSDTLTGLWRRSCETVKKINPRLVMVAPDFSGAVPAADVEAWGPYFDVFTAQSWNIPSPYVNRLSVGCDTKCLVDLCDKPVWMAVQNATSPGETAATPEDIRERYSQVFRNGGRGITLLASEWWDLEPLHPKFASPPKWQAMLDVVDQITHMKQVALPKADCAILFSSDSLLTLRWAQMTNEGHKELYCAYAILGPFLRSWFQFVSDRQIDRGTRDLSRYKALYIPFAKYERASVLDRIEAYVRKGGTVVCTDPEAFSWNVDGESLSERWEKITGVKRTGQRTGDGTIKIPESPVLQLPKGLSVPLPTAGWKIVPLDGQVNTLAAFSDGSPAVTLHPCGKGRVILFASDPSAHEGALVVPGSPIFSLYQALQKAAGARMGHDIWRFKLPPVPPPVAENKAVCLTGNYVEMIGNEPVSKNNVSTGGAYTYSHYPTGDPDVSKGEEAIPFAQGHLTDRLAAYQNRKRSEWVPLGGDLPSKWIVSWTDAATTTVTFDLKSDHDLSKLRFFYSGLLPEVTVLGSRDAQSWDNVATARGRPFTEDVVDVALSLRGNYRFVRLEFGARAENGKLELAEAEIWGNP